MAFLWVVALMAPRASSDGEALPQADGALKVLMVSIGFHGHVIPLVRLAEALVGRGHDVTLATHDSVEARQWARDAGKSAREKRLVRRIPTVARRRPPSAFDVRARRCAIRERGPPRGERPHGRGVARR